MNIIIVKEKEIDGFMVSKIKITPIIVLNVGANISYALYETSSDLLIRSTSIYLCGEEYDLWSNDDMYVINLVLQREGLELIR